MSDQALRYVPCEPSFRPAKGSAQAAARWLEQALGATADVRFLPAVEFIDSGGNWDGVRCPSCGADAEPWWGEAMSAAAESGFASLEVRAPCCGAAVSLNSLSYGWPVAFGSFFIQVANAQRAGLSDHELAALGRELGCPLTEVRVHL